MPLTNKYLLYSPEITFEIFEKVWNKLIELGWKHSCYCKIKQTYEEFLFRGYLRDDKSKTFFPYSHITNEIETTVQDILGYNPFIKDEFILPESWYIKVTKENSNIMSEYFSKVMDRKKDGGIGYYYGKVSKTKSHNGVEVINGYATYSDHKCFDTEITLDQFKQYVMKNQPIDKVEIKKWSVGTYIVPLQDRLLTRNEPLISYKLYKIVERDDNGNKCPYIICENGNKINFCINDDTEKIEGIEWFSTESEALEFCKSIGNSEKDWSKASKEELLVEAKRRYPIGTKFISSYRGTEYIANKDIFIQKELNSLQIDNNGDTAYPYVFYRGVWAEIISLPEIKEVIPEYVEIINGREGANYNHWLGTKDRVSKHYNKEYKIFKVIDSNTDYHDELVYLLSSSDNCYVSFQADACKISTREAFDLQNKPNKPMPVKQPLKQAVNCKSQEEWDFISEKLKLNWTSGKYSNYKEKTCVNTDGERLFSDVAYYERKDYQILSFQEWCDLNRYKMEKILYKKNDYYVVIKEYDGLNGKLNYCYKVYKDSSDRYFYYEYSSNINTDRTSVRPATSEEIAEYNRINKPYDITTLKSKEIEFQVGKWYKLNNCWYAKLRYEVNSDTFYLSESIDIDKIYSDGHSNTSLKDNKTCILIDINSIQQYLPDGHPDKIKSSKIMNNNKIKAGDWVIIGETVEFGGYYPGDFVKVLSIDNSGFSAKEKNSDKVNEGFSLSLNRLATSEEIDNFLNHKSIKSNKEFKEGDYVIITANTNNSTNNIGDFGIVGVESWSTESVRVKVDKKSNTANYTRRNEMRHATYEEIQQHLMTTGLITNTAMMYGTVGDSKPWELSNDRSTNCITYVDTASIRKTDWTIETNNKPNHLLTIDDEELPMVNIIKSKTIKIINLN